jgi:hypothetical protein
VGKAAALVTSSHLDSTVPMIDPSCRVQTVVLVLTLLPVHYIQQ